MLQDSVGFLSGSLAAQGRLEALLSSLDHAGSSETSAVEHLKLLWERYEDTLRVDSAVLLSLVRKIMPEHHLLDSHGWATTAVGLAAEAAADAVLSVTTTRDTVAAGDAGHRMLESIGVCTLPGPLIPARIANAFHQIRRCLFAQPSGLSTSPRLQALTSGKWGAVGGRGDQLLRIFQPLPGLEGHAYAESVLRCALQLQAATLASSPHTHPIRLLSRAVHSVRHSKQGPTAAAALSSVPLSAWLLRSPLLRYAVLQPSSHLDPLGDALPILCGIAPPSSCPISSLHSSVSITTELTVSLRTMILHLSSILRKAEASCGSPQATVSSMETWLGASLPLVVSVVATSVIITGVVSWCGLVNGAVRECDFILLHHLLDPRRSSTNESGSGGDVWCMLSGRGQLAIEVLIQSLPSFQWHLARETASQGTSIGADKQLSAVRELMGWAAAVLTIVEDDQLRQSQRREASWGCGIQVRSTASGVNDTVGGVNSYRGYIAGRKRQEEEQEEEEEEPGSVGGSSMRSRAARTPRSETALPRRRGRAENRRQIKADGELWLDAYQQAAAEALLLRSVRVRVNQAISALQGWLGELADRLRGHHSKRRGSQWMAAQLGRRRSSVLGDDLVWGESKDAESDTSFFLPGLNTSASALFEASARGGAFGPGAGSWSAVVTRLSATAGALSLAVCESSEEASLRLRHVRPPSSIIRTMYSRKEQPAPMSKRRHARKQQGGSEARQPFGLRGLKGKVTVWYQRPVEEGVTELAETLQGRGKTDGDGTRGGRRRGATPRSDAILGLLRLHRDEEGKATSLDDRLISEGGWWHDVDALLAWSGLLWPRRYPDATVCVKGPIATESFEHAEEESRPDKIPPLLLKIIGKCQGVFCLDSHALSSSSLSPLFSRFLLLNLRGRSDYGDGIEVPPWSGALGQAALCPMAMEVPGSSGSALASLCGGLVHRSSSTASSSRLRP